MAGEQWKECSEDVKNILDKEGFGVQDFWEGYKLYCFGRYSHCTTSRILFRASKMGGVMGSLEKESQVTWGKKFDEEFKSVLAMIEEYVKVRHGKDCTNLRALLEEFEDVKELSKFENGCLLMQLVEEDEHRPERAYMKSMKVEIQTTDIFENLRARLDRAHEDLVNLSPQSKRLKTGTSSDGKLKSSPFKGERSNFVDLG